MADHEHLSSPWRSIGERVRSAARNGTALIVSGEELPVMLRAGFLEWLAKHEALEIEGLFAPGPEAETMPNAFSVSALAERWGVSTTSLYNQIKTGGLPALRLGGRLYRITGETVAKIEREVMGPLSAADASARQAAEDRFSTRLARKPNGTSSARALARLQGIIDKGKADRKR